MDEVKSRFIVRETKKQKFVKVGRMIRQPPNLLVIIDGVGRFVMKMSSVAVAMTRGGKADLIRDDLPVGLCGKREGGNGLWMCAFGERYVIPGRSLRLVMEDGKKGPVFRGVDEIPDPPVPPGKNSAPEREIGQIR